MDFDVVIVGAGAAGLAAARRLYGRKRAVVLEARERAGGRGFTLDAGGWPLDLGCGWLHSADRNPLTGLAEQLGLTIDRTPAAWGNEAPGFGMGAAQRAAFGRAMAEMEGQVDKAAKAPQDCAVSSLLDPQGLWTPLLNAFSSYYNGAEFDQVSAKDYAAFEDDGVNWRVTEGLGRAIASPAEGLDIRFTTPVTCIYRSGTRLRLETPRGTVEAARAIVTVPTDLLAQGQPRFSPDLPAHRLQVLPGIQPAHPHAARRRQHQSVDQARQGALAGAVGADDADAALGQHRAHPAQHFRLGRGYNRLVKLD